MSQWTKTFRRYERHILLGIVILLLISFSVTGALQRCSGPGAGAGRKLGGSFQASPTQRSEVSDLEFDQALTRFQRFVGSTYMAPTLDFQRWNPSAPKGGTGSSIRHAWLHVILARMAAAAGFHCGEGQLSTAIKEALRSAQGMGGLQGTREGYEQFLSKLYGGSAKEFETTLREIVAKDELLSVLVDPARFHLTYEEAYERWKPSRERVNLMYAAAAGRDFAAEVEQEERTRSTLSEQEDVLRAVSESARRMKQVQQRLEDARAALGAYPEKLLDLVAPASGRPPAWSALREQLEDAWGTLFAYERGEAGVVLRSAGPDKQAGTADDLGANVHLQLDAHRRLAQAADALVRWHNAADPAAWPTQLAEVTQAPPRKPAEPGAPPPPVFVPLPKLEQDPWGSDLVYAPPAAADAAPTLSSAGPDKQPGTADDIVAAVSSERARVAPGPGLAAFRRDDLRDAWGRPLSAHLRLADQGVWEVTSLGRDGQGGTSDDLVTGNRTELEIFYGDAAVREEMREPLKRRFQALYLHLPLVSDATLRQLWLDFPQLRPTSKDDERMLYDRWTSQRGSSESYEFRAGTDPRDPETGHGAALAQRLGWKPEAVTLVPAAEVFSVPAEPAPPAPAAAPAPAPAPADPAASPEPPDPLRKEYEERGWKQILLRQEFLERVLYQFWKDVVESQTRLAAWEASPLRITRRPEAVELQSLLQEDKLGKYLPGAADLARGHRFLEFYETGSEGGQPRWLTDTEINALPAFGDPEMAKDRFIANTTGREPASIPVQLNRRLTKVLYQNLEYRAPRTPDLAEVRERVFALYLVKKQAERAERELKALRADVEKRTAERKEGETDEQLWTAAAEAWKQAHPGVTLFVESTGLYIGSERPRRPALPAEGPEREALLRRLFVRDAGYALVQPVASRQDTSEASPGTFGRTVLKDGSKGAEATGCAYLVRVKERVFPSKAEFSPQAYSEWLEDAVFGRMHLDPRMEQGTRMGMREGVFNQTLAQYLDEVERLQVLVDLRTNTNLDQLSGL